MTGKSEFTEYKREALNRQFSRLNGPQREAVFTVRGPLLILAGAGSGKTTVLINRIAYLLQFGDVYHTDYVPEDLSAEDLEFMRGCARDGIRDPARFRLLCGSNPPTPWSVMAITFTNKAADELKKRLADALGDRAQGILASTFHSACVRFLRRNADKVGLGANFTIYDSDDSLRLVNKVVSQLNMSEEFINAKQIRNEISYAKNRFVDAEKYDLQAGADYRKQVISRVYTEYQNQLTSNNSADFDDLLLLCVKLFEENPDVLRSYQDRFSYILVDEYQDTNLVQYRLVALLAGKSQNLCVVGDDDQSIYRFRGADIRNILSFEKQFEFAKIIRLEQNYRSTGNILDAANAVIAKNEHRKGKTLWTDGDRGSKIIQREFLTENEEARFIARRIKENAENGGRYSDCAVLYRVNAISNSIERALVSAGVPYRVFGGARFYDRKEIKDMLAYLSLLVSPGDAVRLSRIINEPKRGIGDSTVASVIRISRETGLTAMEVIKNCGRYAALSPKSKPLLAFYRLMEDLKAQLENGVPMSKVYEQLLDKSGYMSMLEAGGPAEEGRVENVRELMSELKKYEAAPGADLEGFLADCVLMTDFDNYDSSADAAVLMTVHGAKGLEFKTVFVAACEENIFPDKRCQSMVEEMEEERRLAYVAFTRARDNLIITHTMSRMLYGTTLHNRLSRFAADIPEELKSVGLAVSRQNAYNASRGYPRNRITGIGQRVHDPDRVRTPKQIDLRAGMAVTHPVFGTGIVMSVENIGNDRLVEIAFDSCGTKRIMANYVRLTTA